MPAPEGHRVVEDWMGEKIETLADLLPNRPLAVCVGLNPAPVSVAVGHYYQGLLGQRFWSRLSRAGLVRPVHDGLLRHPWVGGVPLSTSATTVK